MKHHNMHVVGLGNIKILTDHVSKPPLTLGHLLKVRFAGKEALHSCPLHLDHAFMCINLSEGKYEPYRIVVLLKINYYVPSHVTEALVYNRYIPR